MRKGGNPLGPPRGFAAGSKASPVAFPGRYAGSVIDPHVLRTDPDRVRASQRARGASESLVDDLVAADQARRDTIAAYEELRAEQKNLGRQLARAQDQERNRLIGRTKELADLVKKADAAQHEVALAFDEMLRQVGNLVFPDVPLGGEDDYVVLETSGEPRDFAAEGFAPKDHVELGALLGAIDIERGAKVSGSRFYYLTGVGAELELALINLAMSMALRNGFTPMIPPALVKPAAMEGTGFLGQAAKDVYHLEADDLYLVGTAEVPLAAYHSDEILDAGSLPRRYAGFSPSYRREAGAHGKDTRGIFRVHWFDKVEMFSFCAPEDADAEHRRLLAWEKEFISALEFPFQVLELAAGDLGLSAARKYDCYGWLPSQERYREITSTSNCTDFQARRLNIRGRFADGTRPVATLNGTLCAMTRTVIMILENHQQADGSVRVPAALRAFLGGREVLTPR
jgi:seryl-tRNA synthetase